MKKVIFYIDEKVNGKVGSNKFYSGVHWAVRKKLADYWHELVVVSMVEQKIPCMPFNKPVRVTLTVNSRLDIDNHGFLAKLIIDGLKGYLIEDDNRKFVQELKICFYDEDMIKVEVEEIGGPYDKLYY